MSNEDNSLSEIGDSNRLSFFIFSESISIKTTLYVCAIETAEDNPTYPAPATTTFIYFLQLFLLYNTKFPINPFNIYFSLFRIDLLSSLTSLYEILR